MMPSFSGTFDWHLFDMFSTDFAFMTGMMPASIGTSIPAALALSRNLRKSSLS